MTHVVTVAFIALELYVAAVALRESYYGRLLSWRALRSPRSPRKRGSHD